MAKGTNSALPAEEEAGTKSIESPDQVAELLISAEKADIAAANENLREILTYRQEVVATIKDKGGKAPGRADSGIQQGVIGGLLHASEVNELYSGYERKESNLQVEQKSGQADLSQKGTLNLFAPTEVSSEAAARQTGDNFRIRYEQIEAGQIKAAFDIVKTPSNASIDLSYGC